MQSCYDQAKPNNGTMALKILTTDDPRMLALTNTCTQDLSSTSVTHTAYKTHRLHMHICTHSSQPPDWNILLKVACDKAGANLNKKENGPDNLSSIKLWHLSNIHLTSLPPFTPDLCPKFSLTSNKTCRGSRLTRLELVALESSSGKGI